MDKAKDAAKKGLDKSKDVAGKTKTKVDSVVDKNREKLPDKVEKAYDKASKAADKVLPGDVPAEQVVAADGGQTVSDAPSAPDDGTPVGDPGPGAPHDH